MVAQRVAQPNLSRSALDHAHRVIRVHAGASQLPPPVERSKQGSSFLPGDARGRNVREEIFFGDVMCRNDMVLSSLFPESESPTTAVHREVILDVHVDHRTDTGEGKQHDAEERPVPQTCDRVYVDRFNKLASFAGCQHWRLADLHDVLWTFDGRGRIELKNVLTAEGIEEFTDRGEVLLHGRRSELLLQLLYIGSDDKGFQFR